MGAGRTEMPGCQELAPPGNTVSQRLNQGSVANVMTQAGHQGWGPAKGGASELGG
jgi:hypothetical protein